MNRIEQFIAITAAVTIGFGACDSIERAPHGDSKDSYNNGSSGMPPDSGSENDSDSGTGDTETGTEQTLCETIYGGYCLPSPTALCSLDYYEAPQDLGCDEACCVPQIDFPNTCDYWGGVCIFGNCYGGYYTADLWCDSWDLTCCIPE